MRILAFESSAKAASVALIQDGVLLAEHFQNNGKTHSATLMPMAKQVLEDCGITASDLDAVAVAKGPGSFTGVRIGVAAAKGLAWKDNKPCAPCSTLASMAWGVAHMGGEICAVMDARRDQVYNARFRAEGGRLTRLTPDRAIALPELLTELEREGSAPVLVGDGAALCRAAFDRAGVPYVTAPPHLTYQTAWGVAKEALELAQSGGLVAADALVPQYHRLSQAERERLEREQKREHP